MVQALDAIAKHGRNKEAARALGLSPRTIELQIYLARKRITKLDPAANVSGRVRLLRLWMDYRNACPV